MFLACCSRWEGSTYQPGQQYHADSDHTFTAKWKQNEPPAPAVFTVTFVDGLGNTLDTQTVESGKAATAPADPTRKGYTFDGWDTDFSNVTSDLTVTAKWKKNEQSKPSSSSNQTAKKTSKASSSSKVAGTTASNPSKVAKTEDSAPPIFALLLLLASSGTIAAVAKKRNREL